jgi:Family of unknown function (DUF5824)
MATRSAYMPKKYFSGLSKTRKLQRKKEIRKFGALHWKDPKAYVGFQTDKAVRTKSSGYTAKWRQRFPSATSLKQKSQVTGVPMKYIQKSYDRGMAAWRTGHRPGATQQQWGYARVHSFLLCGKTHYSTDSDLVRDAKRTSAKARAWWQKGCRRGGGGTRRLR